MCIKGMSHRSDMGKDDRASQKNADTSEKSLVDAKIPSQTSGGA